ncbi:MAG: non-heme iron oxygenase ferredoxin subunit [Chloroflexota bacterium]
MAHWACVGKTSDFAEGELSTYDFEYDSAVIIRLGDKFFALEDCCSHQEFPLSEGEIEGNSVVCTLHGARFDIRTGAALTLPATEAVSCYATKIEDGSLFIEEPED